MAKSEEIDPTRDDDGNPIWGIAGYMDFKGTYHDFTFVNVAQLGDDIYPDMDLVTISWTDAEDGTIQFARLEGPYEDFDNLEDVVDTYFKEGSE